MCFSSEKTGCTEKTNQFEFETQSQLSQITCVLVCQITSVWPHVNMAPLSGYATIVVCCQIGVYIEINWRQLDSHDVCTHKNTGFQITIQINAVVSRNNVILAAISIMHHLLCLRQLSLSIKLGSNCRFSCEKTGGTEKSEQTGDLYTQPNQYWCCNPNVGTNFTSKSQCSSK